MHFKLYRVVSIASILCSLLFLCSIAESQVFDSRLQIEDIRKAHNELPVDVWIEVDRATQDRQQAQARTLGPFISVQVNVDSDGNNIIGDAANEPSIALNPVNNDNLVIGWRQFDTISNNFRQAGVAFTNNGGSSWNNDGPLDAGVFRSDPVLDADGDGNIYYYSLTTNAQFSEFFCDMFISNDGGVSWSDPIPAGGGDKQWMVIDRTAGSSDGFIHAIWNRFFTCCPPGYFTRSTDAGLNYLDPIDIAQDIFWGTLSVGPDGELYICGRNIDNDPIVIRSDNADELVTPTFPQATIVDMNGNSTNSVGPNPGGLLGQYDIETDHTDGPNRGNVYFLGSTNPPGPDPLDIAFSRSVDGGLTWAPPTRINNDAQEADAFNWFGTMSVAPGGRIDVIWNRQDPATFLSAMFYSASFDAGLSWTENVQVTESFDPLVGHPNQNKIGDYYDMRSTDDAVHVAYSATFNDEQDVYYLRIPVGEVLLGDVNQDGVVNLLDVAPFIAVLSSNNYQGEADCNKDGSVNLLDVEPFVAILSGS